MPFPSLTLSADVRALTDRFVETPINGTITFSDMSEAIASDIAARRYLIQRALHVSSRESGAIFAALRGVGYRRLSAEEAAKVGSHARHRIRSTSKRAKDSIISAVEKANDLSDEARKAAFREVNMLGLLRHIATDRASAAVLPTDRPQPVAATLRNMMTHLGARIEQDEVVK